MIVMANLLPTNGLLLLWPTHGLLTALSLNLP
jgi:hypothetical protein